MDKLIIIMPVYNEAENIIKTVSDWYPLTELGNSSKLLLINDGSTDTSQEIIEELQLDHPNLLLHNKANGGHGHTVRLGYQLALDNAADYIFQTDSDGQTNPEEFYEFWQNRDKYNAILGNRRNREDGLYRKFVSLVLRVVNRFMFGVYLQDANVPFRLIQRETLEELLPHIPEDFRLSNVLLSVLLKNTKRNVKLIDISFKDRFAGTNSINFRTSFSEAVLFLKQVKELRRTHTNYKES